MNVTRYEKAKGKNAKQKKMKKQIINRRNIFILNTALTMILIFAAISAARSFFFEIEVATLTSREISTTLLEDNREIKPIEYFDIILKNNIFDAGLITKKVVEAKRPAPKPLRWELKGTTYVPNEYVAYIEDKGQRKRKGNPPLKVKVGDRILEYDVEILEIRKNYVKYLRFGTEEGELVKEKPTIFGASKPKKDYTGIVEQRSRGNFLVSLSGIKKEIPNIDSVMQSIEVKPYASPTKPNTIVGLRVTRISSDSIVSALGIENGYIIETIDGKTIDSKEKIISALEDVEAGKKLSVRLIREGRPQALVYEIRR